VPLRGADDTLESNQAARGYKARTGPSCRVQAGGSAL